MAIDRVLLGDIGRAVRWNLDHSATPVVSLVCQKQHLNDEIAQGNALAKALSLGLNLSLNAQGMSWRYTVALLESLLPHLEPFTLFIIAAENAPEMVEALAQLPELEVVPHFSHTVPTYASDRPILPLDQMRQPRQPTQPRTPKAVLLRFQNNLKNQQWGSALELAVHNVPGQLVEHLDQIGWGMLAQGLAPSLFMHLSQVTEPYATQPKVLRWRLAAAIETWQFEGLLPVVESSLQQQDDPELRAFYALALYHATDNQGAVVEIERVLEQQRSALTLTLAGQIFQSNNPSTAKAYLQQALKYAEREHRPLQQARIALYLSQTSLQLWDPKASQHWAEWCIRTLEEYALHNAPLRLEAANMLIVSRLYQGDTVGLESQLTRESQWLAQANPRLHNVFDWTRAELLLYQGRAEEALEVIQKVWARVKQRESLALYGVVHVQILLELGKSSQAKRIAEQIVALNEDSDPYYQAQARLAYLIWRSIGQPAAVVAELQGLAEWFDLMGNGYASLITQLHLARALMAAERQGEAEAVLIRLEPIARRFGRGLRALVGPSPAFEALFLRLEGQEEALVMEFLGGVKAKLYGVPLALRQRHADILTALALKPEGLSTEQVAMAIYGDGRRAGSARTELKRTKRLVPLKGGPFKIQVEYKADFLEVKRLLRQGDLRGALNRYKGALLPESTAPLVEEERYIIEETLRAAALESHDPEALLVAAELLGEDLEVWEKTVEALPQIDPRRALAEARRRQIVRDWELN